MTAEFRAPDIAPLPGTYALLLKGAESASLRIGRLGDSPFPHGFYVYVGSAFGSGGVRGRVERHLRTEKRIRWHIDLLSAAMRIEEVWWTYDPQRRECAWSRVMERMAAGPPFCPGFGSSDCRCPSHLFFFPSLPSIRTFRKEVVAAIPDHAKIERVVLQSPQGNGK